MKAHRAALPAAAVSPGHPEWRAGQAVSGPAFGQESFVGRCVGLSGCGERNQPAAVVFCIKMLL